MSKVNTTNTKAVQANDDRGATELVIKRHRFLARSTHLKILKVSRRNLLDSVYSMPVNADGPTRDVGNFIHEKQPGKRQNKKRSRQKPFSMQGISMMNIILTGFTKSKSYRGPAVWICASELVQIEPFHNFYIAFPVISLPRIELKRPEKLFRSTLFFPCFPRPRRT